MVQNVARTIREVALAERRLRPFLRRNHAELERFIGQGRIDWVPVQQLVQKLDLVDARGRPPTAAAIARAWRWVSLEATVAPVKLPSRHEALPAGTITAGVRLAFPASSSGVRPFDGEPTFTTRAAVPTRPASPSGPGATERATATSTSVSEREGTADLIRRARDRVAPRHPPRPTDT